MNSFGEYLRLLENSTIAQELGKEPDKSKIKVLNQFFNRYLADKIGTEKYRSVVSAYMTFMFKGLPSEEAERQAEVFWQEYGALLVAKENNEDFRRKLVNPTFGKDQLSHENHLYHREIKVGKGKNKGGPGLPVVDVAAILSQHPELAKGEDHEAAKEYDPKHWVGWHWVSLGKKSCSQEAAAAGHCGNAGGHYDDNIFSLRDPKDRVHLTFIMNNGSLGEAKGTNNDKPEAEYHPAIAALMLSGYMKEYRGGGYAPENNFEPDDLPHSVYGYTSRHMRGLPGHKNPENFWSQEQVMGITQDQVEQLPPDRKLGLLQSYFNRAAVWNNNQDENDDNDWVWDDETDDWVRREPQPKSGFSQKIHFSPEKLAAELRPMLKPAVKIGVFVDSIANASKFPEGIDLTREYADDVVRDLPRINSYAALSNFLQGLMWTQRVGDAAHVLTRMGQIAPVKETDFDIVLTHFERDTYQRQNNPKNDQPPPLSEGHHALRNAMIDLVANDRVKLRQGKEPKLMYLFDSPEQFADYLVSHPNFLFGYNWGNIYGLDRKLITALIDRGIIQVDKVDPNALINRLNYNELKALAQGGKLDFNKVSLYSLSENRNHHSLLYNLVKDGLIDLRNYKAYDVLHYIGGEWLRKVYPDKTYLPELQREVIKMITDRDWNKGHVVLTATKAIDILGKDNFDSLLRSGMVNPYAVGWSNLRRHGYTTEDLDSLLHHYPYNSDHDEHGSRINDLMQALATKHGGDYDAVNKKRLIAYVEKGQIPFERVRSSLPGTYRLAHDLTQKPLDPKVIDNDVRELFGYTASYKEVQGRPTIVWGYVNENNQSRIIYDPEGNTYNYPKLRHVFDQALQLKGVPRYGGTNDEVERVEQYKQKFFQIVLQEVNKQFQAHMGVQHKDQEGFYLDTDQERVASNQSSGYNTYTLRLCQDMPEFLNFFENVYKNDPDFTNGYEACRAQGRLWESRPNQWLEHMHSLTAEQIAQML